MNAASPFSIGDIEIRNPVFLAPMSGITDVPFRNLAWKFGAGLVISEMVASQQLAEANAETLRKAEGGEFLSPFVIQLAGREEKWMAEGARIAEDMGADIIDINMATDVLKGSLAGWFFRKINSPQIGSSFSLSRRIIS